MLSVLFFGQLTLAGSTASGLYEARLGREEFDGEVHVFCPAYKDAEIDELVKISDHIVFNSVSQLYKFSDKCKGVSIGLRINPECSTQDEPIYDPCAPNSRLGVTLSQFDEKVLDIIDCTFILCVNREPTLLKRPSLRSKRNLAGIFPS